MLVSKPCPHTGVVNFFHDSEPHIAIGSIIKSNHPGADARYVWRFYALEGAPSGHAENVSAAEKKLVALFSKTSDTRFPKYH